MWHQTRGSRSALTLLFHADYGVYLKSFYSRKIMYCTSKVLSRKLRGARSQPETSKAIGQPVLRHLHVIYSRATEYICLDYPWNKPVPILPRLLLRFPLIMRGERAPRKADKWSQFVHFMRSYIIRETSRSHFWQELKSTYFLSLSLSLSRI